MATIMLIIDGAMPSDYRDCTNIDYIKKTGNYGQVNNTPIGFQPNSLTCIMNILGVDTNKIPEGRAYLEALAINEKVNDNDLLLRCNNVDIEDGKLISSCSKKINFPSKLGHNIKLIHMGEYKNLLIIKNAAKEKDSLITYAPHQNIGTKISEIMPESKNQKLNEMLRSLVLNYNLFPWGQAVKVDIPSFEEIHHQKGAVVCGTEIVKGIGKAMKMHCPDIDTATADIDTDLIKKGRTALKLIKEYDFVLIHINGSDESAHRGNKKEKINFIKKIDSKLIKLITRNIDKNTTLIITSDHGTSSETGEHVNGLVNYYVLNGNGGEDIWLKR